MNPRVLLDVDGVLADFHTPCLEIINRLTGQNHKIEDFDSWDIFDALKVPSEIRSKVYDEMNSPGWCTKIQFYPGSQEGVAKLASISHLYIVTSPMRGETWTSERDRWLARHFGLTTKQIIHGSAKYVCAGDYLVDDKIDNLAKWKNSHPNGYAVRWVMPHLANHAWDGMQTHEWSQLITWVRELPILPRMWRHEA